MHELPQQLVIGLSVGATYALIALGYTMVYGVLRLINFAHGDVYMVGAVTGLYLVNATLAAHFNIWLAIAVAFAGATVACGLLGFIIEFFAYRPLRTRPKLALLITAIGVSMLLENLFQLRWIFGPTPQTFPLPAREALSARVFVNSGLQLTRFDVLSFGLSIFLMIVLTFVVLKTRTGLALRAVSHRFDTAKLMGINTNRVISFTFILGSALAAVAGVLDGIRYNVHPLMGISSGLKAFIAAVLGGIGSIPGALVGGLLIGVTEALVAAYVNSAYVDAVAFVVLILILLLKPSGLFGRSIAEKV